MGATEAKPLLERLDASRESLNAVLGPSPASRETWESIRSACRGAADPASRILLSRAETALGRPREALEALAGLSGAAALRAEAEARLPLGELAAARSALDAALSLAPKDPQARLLSASTRLASGDLEGAGADLDAAEAAAAPREAALAARALLMAQSGREADGVALLDQAIKAAATGWLHALRGTLRRGLGDLPGARADLDRAVETEASPWVLAARADVLTRSGFYKDALKDLERASALAPGSAALHAQAANVYFDQAFYTEAIQCSDKALALGPADPGLLARRARFDTVLGKLAEAERGYTRSLELAPHDSQIRFERLSVLALLDRGAEVLRALKEGGLPPVLETWLRAVVAFRAGKRGAARKLFLQVAEGGHGGLSERARLNAEVAYVLGDRTFSKKPPKRAKGSPDFYMCGIGILHPFQATVEIMRTLDRCGVIYNNLGDPQIADFLGLFRAEIRAVDRRPGEPAMGRVRRILAGVAPGKLPTGFVTRIHPFIYRRIANDLAQHCEDTKISYRAYASVSLTEAAWGLGDEKAPVPPRGAPFASRVFDLIWLVKRPHLLDPDLVNVVYCIADADQRRKLCSIILEKYPPRHPAYMLAGSGDKENEVREFTVTELAEALPGYDLGAVLYLPAAGKGRTS